MGPVIRVSAEGNAPLFTAFALLNATHYNSENGWIFSPVREAVRLSLARRGDVWRRTLAGSGLLDGLHRSGGALLMDVVPAFSLGDDLLFTGRFPSYLTSWQAESEQNLAGIEEWLPRFYQEERISDLWAAHQSAYMKAATMLRATARELTDLAARFEESGTLDVLLWPNLLDIRGRGYSVSDHEHTWLYLGPVQDATKARSLAVHELMHRWADPVADLIAKEYRCPPMPEARARFRIVSDLYPDPAIWVGETVVRAFTLWMTSQFNNQSLIDYWEKIGFIGVDESLAFLDGHDDWPYSRLIEGVVRLVCERALATSSAD